MSAEGENAPTFTSVEAFPPFYFPCLRGFPYGRSSGFDSLWLGVVLVDPRWTGEPLAVSYDVRVTCLGLVLLFI